MKNIYHDVTVEMEFEPLELEQLFCSCSTAIDVHNSSCPNFGKIFSYDPSLVLTFRFSNGKVAKVKVDNPVWIDLGEINNEWPEPEPTRND